MSCQHHLLYSTPSPHAAQAGYHQPSSAGLAGTSSFPAPLVLPGDDLALDPDYPTQTVREWSDDEDRNPVTPDRRTIYVVPPPETDSANEYIHGWTRPAASSIEDIPSPDVSRIVEYLSAFYDGIQVTLFPTTLSFTSWGKTKAKGKTWPIGLNTASESIRIRTRTSLDGVYPRQLNLDDLLDVAISVLPDDAFALLMLTNHDLFEDEEDLFVCGRAYGGSRVAVVSTARYHPGLDSQQSVERVHAWPASHCAEYVRKCCDAEPPPKKKQKKKLQVEDDQPPCHALREAVSAHTALPSLVSSPSIDTLCGLWFGRVCRTAGHELGHCFGIDHCMHGYACNMQGSSSIEEDARQPPYLCPVDLSKVLQASGVDTKHRYQSLFSFCQRYQHIHLFAAFGAWIHHRLSEI